MDSQSLWPSGSSDAVSSTSTHLSTESGSIYNSSPFSLVLEVQQRLDILANVATLLGIDDPTFASYSAAITRISTREQEALQSLNRLTIVERELKNHLATMTHEELLINAWTDDLGQDLAISENATMIQSRREALLRKAKEYQTGLASIAAKPPVVSFADVATQQTVNDQRIQSIKAKRAQIKAFRGLPPNLTLAREQLRTAQAEQMELIRIRERLLGQMAESVA
ncbi:PCI domain-containing protein [Favolaschia claudopus]|uniref:PCI domain-containing protein n=1 Tax=Favolaschia claudopus TaxID=2862362 RepID=A0AAW0AF90_9AGAR